VALGRDRTAFQLANAERACVTLSNAPVRLNAAARSVGFVTSLLKRNERLGNGHQILLDRQREKRSEVVARIAIDQPEPPARLSHDPVAETPPDSWPQEQGLRGRQPLRALMGEQMKQRIIGGRNGPPQTALSGSPCFPQRAVFGLFGQVVMQSHYMVNLFFKYS
jgi:hypothetical protein